MRHSILLFCALALRCIDAQVGGGSSDKLQDAPPANLPSARLTFSEPKLDSPLALPSSIMNGPPSCGPEGRAFIEFMTSPPIYNVPVIASVSQDGKVTQYSLNRIIGLTNALIVSFDPGVTMAVMLLRATPTSVPRRGSAGFYLTLFDYEGEVRSYSRLDLGFDPTSIAQLTDNSFLIIGVDREKGKARFVLTDSDGTLQRDLNADSIMPSKQELEGMLGSMNFVGSGIAALPPSQRIGATLSMFRPIHSRNGLLTLEPGAGAKIFELSRSGEARIVQIDLPPNQVADSLVADKDRWFVRALTRGNDSDINLYEIDPESGSAVRRIDTSGVPATSIACPAGSGFYGLRWVEKKPYLIYGDMRQGG